MKTIFFTMFIASILACKNPSSIGGDQIKMAPVLLVDSIRVGAENPSTYLPLLKGKRIACVVNQTSMIKQEHLLDFLQSQDVDISKIFALEHGIRGTADAGEHIKDGKDVKTGAPIISLYGKNSKPSPEDLKDIDVILFDIQDVGVRFYTFISSLHYIMEAAAEQNKMVIVLDRPNPHTNYVDGPILDTAFSSFVGIDPLPIVYGMTIGELATMINQEGWLKNHLKCQMRVVQCENFDRNVHYELPVKPSPNLPNLRSILLYPSLCFFEGTTVSVGRGTEKQFQIFGAPGLDKTYDFSFTPQPNEGAKTPLHNGELCYGVDLSEKDLMGINSIDYSYLLGAYKASKIAKIDFFTSPDFFDKLAGSDQMRKIILEGGGADQIRNSYVADLEKFKVLRAKYLIY